MKFQPMPLVDRVSVLKQENLESWMEYIHLDFPRGYSRPSVPNYTPGRSMMRKEARKSDPSEGLPQMEVASGKEAKADKAARKLRNLRKLGLCVEILNNGFHLTFPFKGDRINYWPTTGKWQRGSGPIKGVEQELLELLGFPTLRL